MAPKPTVSEPGGQGLAAYYDLDVERLFLRSCGPGCHEVDPVQGPQIGARQTGLALTPDRAYDALFGPEGSKNGPLVIPGRAEDSLLFWKIAIEPSLAVKRFGALMPAGLKDGRVVDGSPLPSDEVEGIRNWIQSGARRTTVPRLPEVSGAVSVDARTVDVTFSGEIAGGAPDLARRYTVFGGGRGLKVISAAVTGSRGVRLTTEAQSPGAAYSVTVFGVASGTSTAAFQFVPPVLTLIRATPVDSGSVDLFFSEPVDPVTAAQPGRYAIQGLTVHSATLMGQDVVRLGTTPFQSGAAYTVAVTGVQSLRGGALQAGQGDRASFNFVPPVAFSREVQPIFTGSCAFVGCHGGAGATYGLRLEAGFSYGSTVGAPSVTRPSLSRVKAGDPDNSLLIQKLTGAPGVGSRMPLGGALRDADIETIRRWIQEGAKDN